MRKPFWSSSTTTAAEFPSGNPWSRRVHWRAGSSRSRMQTARKSPALPLPRTRTGKFSPGILPPANTPWRKCCLPTVSTPEKPRKPSLLLPVRRQRCLSSTSCAPEKSPSERWTPTMCLCPEPPSCWKVARTGASGIRLFQALTVSAFWMSVRKKTLQPPVRLPVRMVC